MRTIALAAVAAAWIAGPALARPAAQAGEQELRQAADTLAKEYDHSYNAKNASGMAALYAPNGILVPPGRAPVEGRPAIAAYYQGRFDQGIGGHVTRITEVHPLGDGGLALGRFSIQAPGPNGPHEVHGNVIYVVEH